MTDYWQSTKAPVNIYKQSIQLQKLETFLRNTMGVDPVLLAQEIGMQCVGPEQIKVYQRKLGLRKLTGNPVKKKQC